MTWVDPYTRQCSLCKRWGVDENGDSVYPCEWPPAVDPCEECGECNCDGSC